MYQGIPCKSDPAEKAQDFGNVDERIVDFLKKAGMVVSIIEITPKSEEDSVSLTEAIRICSSVIKAENISDIANTNILNHEMAEHLENKPKKTLIEMHL
ncbi:ribonuclease h-like protein [Gigaspora margarita]|uniref:Ribonuclease h-like protein n=1 Tax=Gigaspora margarita TaxID=4874 RepID=A0A8H4A3Y3_GIGMA|nr:ribonuclease h-like protein [Gigaspora margarita]